MRGKWMIIDDAHVEEDAGPLYALFVDGVILASCCESLKHGHWSVCVYSTRVWSEGPTASTVVTDADTARRLCLQIACLTKEEVEGWEEIVVPPIFNTAFEKE